MANIHRLYDFQAGTKIISDQVDAEFNQLINYVNGLAGTTGATKVGVGEGGNLQTLLDKLVRFATANVKHIRLNEDKVIETSANGVDWEASGSSGHLIQRANGTILPQRSRLQFTNMIITDDEANNRTVVESPEVTPDDIGAVNKTGDTMTGSLDATDVKVNGTSVYHPNNKPSASDIGAPALIEGIFYTFADLWERIDNTNQFFVGLKFRDMGGFGPWGEEEQWYQGYAVYQNTLDSPYDYDISGTIFLGVGGNILYRGDVFGNSLANIGVSWYKVYDEGVKPTPDEIGAVNKSNEGTDYCGIDPNNAGKIKPERASALIKSVTTSYTLGLADAGRLIQCSNSSAINVTIPTNASVAFLLNTEIEILRGGFGAVTIAAASGVTIRCPTTARTISNRYASICLKKYEADSWLLQGALA